MLAVWVPAAGELVTSSPGGPPPGLPALPLAALLAPGGSLLAGALAGAADGDAALAEVLHAEVARVRALRDSLVAGDAAREVRLRAAYNARFEIPLRASRRRALALCFMDMMYFVVQTAILVVLQNPPEEYLEALAEQARLTALLLSIAFGLVGLVAIMRLWPRAIAAFMVAQCATIILLVRGAYIVWLFLAFRLLSVLAAMHLRVTLTRARRAADMLDAQTRARAYLRASILEQLDAITDVARELLATAAEARRAVEAAGANGGGEAVSEVMASVRAAAQERLHAALLTLRRILAGAADILTTGPMRDDGDGGGGMPLHRLGALAAGGGARAAATRHCTGAARQRGW